MKIICIGRNYLDHAKEMKATVASEPIFFLKPNSAICIGKVLFYPEFTTNLQHEIEIVVKINRLGKHIDIEHANKYYDEIGLGIDFTARDIQKDCKEKGLPWEKAKAFDNSAVISKKFLPIDKLDLDNLNFSLQINGELKQSGNIKDMIFSIDFLIAYVSKFMTLKIGDLIYTGTPAGVGPVKINDELDGFIESQKMFSIIIK